MINNLNNQHTTIIIEEDKRLSDIAKDILQDYYFCTRVWDAWNYGTITSDDFVPCFDDEDIVANTIAIIRKVEEDAKKLEAILFGRWILKYATSKWSEGFLCYEYNGKGYDTDKLYDIFKQKPYGEI